MSSPDGKSDLFDMSGGELSSNTSKFDLSGSIDLSSLDLDDELESFKMKSKQKKRQDIEMRQLKHDFQLAKIELAQREFELNNYKLDYGSKYENLQEKVNELTHHNQILKVQLDSINAIHQEENKQRQEQIKLELNRILVRQKELEENNERLMKHENEIKKEIKYIDCLNWTNEEYEFMSRREEEFLTIKEFAALKLYTTVKPLKQKLDESLKRIAQLEEEAKNDKAEMKKIKQIYEDEKKTFNVNSMDNQKLYYELADAKAQLQQVNFKKDNFDRIKFERDDLERKLVEAEAKIAKSLANMEVMVRERDQLQKDLNQSKQEISLLKQDKDYLQKQFVETQSKCRIVEDKLEQTEKLYDDAKRLKEDIQEKYINSRESFKHEYDAKLQIELDKLKLQTNQEIERLRENTKEFYERELKNAKEMKDLALEDKQKFELNEKEMTVRYQQAVNELRLVQLNCENKLAEMKTELKMKSFELERAQMLNEENVKNYQKAIMENEKLQKKIQVIQNEFYSIQMAGDKRCLELESELNDKKARLESYEKVENEMDSVIRQVAESSEKGEMNEADAERLLLSYGYGANIMLSSKRRIQQNVHLTKRVLHLEQVCTSLRLELNRERDNTKEITQQLEIAKNVIENTKQPHEFLVRSIQLKETQLKKQQSTIDILKTKIDELSSEREVLIRKQNDMSADIEKLIKNNEELFYIRDELKKTGLLMHNRRVLNPNISHKKSATASNFDLSQPENPMPVMFTAKDQTRLNQSISSSFYDRSRQSPDRRKTVYSIQND